MLEPIPEFGQVVDGARYVLRPGGYVVVLRSGEVATVLTPTGLALPGGGQDPGETPADAAIREAAEECGWQVALGELLCVADELAYAEDEQTYYRKRCTFFRASVIGAAPKTQADHQLVWLPTGNALSQLMFASQRWALEEALKRDSMGES